MHKASDAMTKFCSLGSHLVMIQPYPPHNLAVVQLQVLSQLSDGSVLLKQQETSFEAGLSHQRPKGVDTTARNRPSEVDKTILFSSHSM